MSIIHVLGDINRERHRQADKFGGDQYRHLSDYSCLAILAEEVGELAREIYESDFNYHARDTRPNMRVELIQIAAVAAAWAEAIDHPYEIEIEEFE